MKRVLFVTYGNPEKASRGDDLYSWNIINSIKHCEDVYLHVVSYFEEAKDRAQNYSLLEKIADRLTYVPFVYKNILAIGFSKYPAMIANRKTSQMIETVQDILNKERYDAIIINMFRLSYLIEYVQEYEGTKIFISHNVESQLSKSTYKYQYNWIKRLAYYCDYLKTRYYERRYLAQFDTITTICDVDREMFSEILQGKRIEVLPPVIDIDKHNLSTNKIEDKFILCGAFHWEPKFINLQLLLHAQNISLFKESGYELMIVGRANKGDVEYINKHYPGIYMTGTVDSVIPYYEKARISIVPELVGGGFKLKIAEAVQYGKPIVAIKGSVTDRTMISGKHYIEADTFEKLISKAIQLMGNRTLQNELVENARKLFRDRYSISYAVGVINQLISYDTKTGCC